MNFLITIFRLLLLLAIFLLWKNTVIGQDTTLLLNLKNDSALIIRINKISVSGNDKTRENIILREITIKEGEVYPIEDLGKKIAESKINLLKLPLFNYVTIEISHDENGQAEIDVFVEERWFLWPQIAIINNERNFNTWWQQRDLTKLDYRFYLKKYNVLGLNHILNTGISLGFTREYLFGYQNMALDKKQKHLTGFLLSYSWNKYVFFRTFNNKQETFSGEDKENLHEKYLRLDYSYRPGVYAQHNIRFFFREILISDSLLAANPGFLAGETKKNTFLELQYSFNLDKRDSRSYPLKGFLLNYSITKSGLSAKSFQSPDLLYSRANYRLYYQLAKRFFAAHSITAKFAFKKNEPYFFNKSLGFHDYLRGFEYYVIDCHDYYLSKNLIKFELLPQTVTLLDFIPIKKFKKIHYAFYLNTFFDIGYGYKRFNPGLLQNNLTNRVLFSGGIGLDLVSYYDKVFRLEYSINNLKDKGFFIHFLSPI